MAGCGCKGVGEVNTQDIQNALFVASQTLAASQPNTQYVLAPNSYATTPPQMNLGFLLVIGFGLYALLSGGHR